MAKRQTQEINAGSMADIAFLLLIFFLVTTTMDVDKGITRQLPPLLDEKPEKVEVNERNIEEVFVNFQDKLMANGQEIDVSLLTEKTKRFIKNPADLDDLPDKKYFSEFISDPKTDDKMVEKYETALDLLGNYPVSKGIVSLECDRGTSYEMYIQVQNELARAFNELREELADEKFGKPFEELSEEEQDAIKLAIPISISEKESRNVKKGR